MKENEVGGKTQPRCWVALQQSTSRCWFLAVIPVAVIPFGYIIALKLR